MENPYEILGITQEATQEDIKVAYRQLAKKYHPDVNAQDPQKNQYFQYINMAYTLLSDTELRQKYDRGLIDIFGKKLQRNYQFEENSNFDSKAFYEAIKRELEKRRTEKAVEKKKELNFILKLTFFEAVKGCQKEIILNEEKEIFSIPCGIENGESLNFKSSRGSKVKIKILVAEHKAFSRKNNDIILNLPITIKEAIYGGVIDIPTVYDIVPIRITPNIKSGTLIKLRGKGVLDAKTQEIGDQLTYVHITLPEEISSEFKTVIESLEAKYPYNPRKGIIKKP